MKIDAFISLRPRPSRPNLVQPLRAADFRVLLRRDEYIGKIMDVTATNFGRATARRAYYYFARQRKAIYCAKPMSRPQNQKAAAVSLVDLIRKAKPLLSLQGGTALLRSSETK